MHKVRKSKVTSLFLKHYFMIFASIVCGGRWSELKFATLRIKGQFACDYLSSEKGKHHLVR
jgi:protein subunit release factor B